MKLFELQTKKKSIINQLQESKEREQYHFERARQKKF